MKVIKSKIISTIIAIVALCLLPATGAFAVTPSFAYKYVNGVGNTTAWLNYGSGVGYWSSYITNAANNWMYPGSGMGNPIYINFVGSNYGSMMDFHLNYDAYFGGNRDTYAWTRMFNGSGALTWPWNANWSYAEIHINDDMYRLPSFSNNQALGTTIHEMGHAFGLAHDYVNRYSIMCTLDYGRVVQRVQPPDNDAINIKY